MVLYFSHLQLFEFYFRGVGNYSSFSDSPFCRFLHHQSIDIHDVSLKNEAKCI